MKWNFPESENGLDNLEFVVLPPERFICVLSKITECTINSQKWGLKHAIRLGFEVTEESLLEAGFDLAANQTAYITRTCNLAKSEKSNLWKTLAEMAYPDEIAGLQPFDAVGIQQAYEKMLGRKFEIVNAPNGKFNNAQNILRLKKPKVEAPVNTPMSNDIDPEDDDIPF